MFPVFSQVRQRSNEYCGSVGHSPLFHIPYTLLGDGKWKLKSNEHCDCQFLMEWEQWYKRKYILFSLLNLSHLPCSQRGKQIRWDSGIRQMLKSSSTNDHVKAGDLNRRWHKYCVSILLLALLWCKHFSRFSLSPRQYIFNRPFNACETLRSCNFLQVSTWICESNLFQGGERRGGGGDVREPDEKNCPDIQDHEDPQV